MVTSQSTPPVGARRAALLETATVAAVMTVVVAGGWRLVGEDLVRRQAVAWLANVAALAVIAAGARRRGGSLRLYGVDFRPGGARAAARTFLQAAVTLVLGLVAFVAAGLLLARLVPAGAGAPAADMSGYDYLRGNLPRLLGVLAGVYVASSFGEEVIYRGFLIRRLEDAFGAGRRSRAWAVIGSAVVFGLAHFNWGPVGIAQAACLGLVFGAAFIRTGRNLWALVLAHAAIDTLLMVQMYAGAAAATTR